MKQNKTKKNRHNLIAIEDPGLFSYQWTSDMGLRLVTR